jgi:hypothetical protein
MTKLRATSRAHDADPWLGQILSSILASFNPDITYNLTTLTQPYKDLVLAQSLLGPDSLFYGYFHHSWVCLQEAYLRKLDWPHDQNQARLLVEKWAHLFQKATALNGQHATVTSTIPLPTLPPINALCSLQKFATSTISPIDSSSMTVLRFTRRCHWRNVSTQLRSN